MALDTRTLLDRFLRYVRIDTQADERATTYPSSRVKNPFGFFESSCLCGELGAVFYHEDTKARRLKESPRIWLQLGRSV